jgi:hypothetical protein
MEGSINTLDNKNINNITDEKNYEMPDLQSINKVIFATHFIAFTKQCVKGSIIAVYRFISDEGTFKSNTIETVRDVLRDGNLLFEKTIQYINLCWHNYNKSSGSEKEIISDPYIKNTLNLIMKRGNFLHISCCFNYIWDFCQMLLIYTLGRIDIPELKDKEFLSDSIEVITDGILAYHVDTLNNDKEIKCGDKCVVFEYREDEDFIKIKKK